MSHFRFLPGLLVGCIGFFTICITGAEGYLRQAGPMVGHVDESSAIVWLRLKSGTEIEGTAVQDGDESRVSRIEDLGEGFHRLLFSGMKPAAPTAVRLELDREGDKRERYEVSFRTAPVPAETGTVRIAFGSCANLSRYPTAPIFHAIADEKPDFFVFGGDNVYFINSDKREGVNPPSALEHDWNLYETMLGRHLRARLHPDLQPLLRTIPSYATWDDHDYGPNNADSTFPLREEATRAFRLIWANPFYGTDDVPGIFSSFRHGPVEVFLMDDRTHKYTHLRHRNVSRETGRIWGEAQTEWLLAGLKASTAPVKLIVNGTQFLSMLERGEGHYQEALNERRRVLEFLEHERIGGVAFLTGDRHHSEVGQQAQSGGTLVLEFTSSPLQQGQAVSRVNRPHPNQIWSMRGNSYGLVTVDIPASGEGTIRFEARDEGNRLVEFDGEPLATTWRLEQLSY